MRKDDRQLIIDILIKNNLLTEKQKQELEKEERATGKSILDLIEEKNLIPEETFTKIKSKIFNVPYIELRKQVIPKEVLEIIPEDVAKNYRMVAFKKLDTEIGVAMTNPQSFQTISVLDFIAREKKVKCNYFIASKSGIENALRSYDNIREDVKEAMQTAAADLGVRNSDVQAMQSEDVDTSVVKTAPVSKMVNVILRHAIEGKASDVHIEPVDQETRVRYRVDGVLNTSIVLPKNVHNAIVARIKVLANLKLDETRLPQDGRFSMRTEGKQIDFRVSTMPLMDQEKVVIRILDSSSQIFNLERLGFSGHNLELMKEYIKKPNGMFLLTGPTGSGKSTTLYTLLSMINKEGINIITLEDPVEYYLAGINQTQVKPEIGLSFANGLRSILRQDPDVIMVGEIRDNETAELAVHASLTGHVVFSTLHTNDAFGAIPRLIDMKIEPFLLSSALNLLVAQRLARKVCTSCRVEEALSENIQQEVRKILDELPEGTLPKEFAAGKPLIFYKGKTCSKCEHTGYKGRIALSEVIEVTENMKNILMNNAIHNQDLVDKELKAQGFIYMKADGILKALAGLTTVEEVLSITNE